jgi:hypothetical protein
MFVEAVLLPVTDLEGLERAAVKFELAAGELATRMVTGPRRFKRRNAISKAKAQSRMSLVFSYGEDNDPSVFVYCLGIV